jgi:hypothetical protein
MNMTKEKFPIMLPHGKIVYRKLMSKDYGMYVRINNRVFVVDKWDENETTYPYTCCLTVSNDEWVNYGDTKYTHDRAKYDYKLIRNDFFDNVR